MYLQIVIQEKIVFVISGKISQNTFIAFCE